MTKIVSTNRAHGAGKKNLHKVDTLLIDLEANVFVYGV